jgi:hypothetical protein
MPCTKIYSEQSVGHICRTELVERLEAQECELLYQL